LVNKDECLEKSDSFRSPRMRRVWGPFFLHLWASSGVRSYSFTFEHRGVWGPIPSLSSIEGCEALFLHFRASRDVRPYAFAFEYRGVWDPIPSLSSIEGREALIFLCSLEHHGMWGPSYPDGDISSTDLGASIILGVAQILKHFFGINLFRIYLLFKIWIKIWLVRIDIWIGLSYPILYLNLIRSYPFILYSNSNEGWKIYKYHPQPFVMRRMDE